MLTQSGEFIQKHQVKLEIFHKPESNKEVVNSVLAMDEMEHVIKMALTDPVKAGALLKSMTECALEDAASMELDQRATEQFYSQTV